MIKLIGRVARIGVRISFGILPETLVSFLVVGALGVLVHITVLKTAMLLASSSFQSANLIAMFFAASFNYFLNNQSTFREQTLAGHRVIVGYFSYLCINSLGLGISFFVSSRLYSHYPFPIPAALAGIVSGSLWNYLMSYTFVWKLLSKFNDREA